MGRMKQGIRGIKRKFGRAEVGIRGSDLSNRLFRCSLFCLLHSSFCLLLCSVSPASSPYPLSKSFCTKPGSNVVVQAEFVRMRPQPQGVDFFLLLVPDPGV